MKRLNNPISGVRPRAKRTYLRIACLAASLVPVIAFADCPTQGQWWQAQAPLSNSELLATASQQQVVLLGEQHDQASHHRWQLHTLAGLHALRDDMVIGLEMLPRSAQPALDAWIDGDLDTSALLEKTRWEEVWGFDADLYMPIFQFARMAQIPLIALNIEPALRQRLVNEGWDSVPREDRYAIPPPEPASTDYRSRLTEVFGQHDMGESPEMLERFILAQLSWDIAMAQRLSEAAQDGTLAVGLMGLGHVVYHEGVPHQLDALGIERTFSLLPWQEDSCTPPDPSLADAVFVLETVFETGKKR
ncbi:MAG: hypothetical protein EA345_05760 [Halomonas sp.]|nr:ChaN family lipoprotein [Halomonas sp.]TVP50037.1 MAG: hypothetical protein EA345_05760 [Halomonas sp.]